MRGSPRVLPAVAGDVVPGAHDSAAVDRDRLHRGMGEDKAHAQRSRHPQLGHDRLEVVAVGAEPMEPDDGGARGCARFDLEGLEQVAHAGAQPRVSAATRATSSRWSRVASLWSLTTWRPWTQTSVIAWGDMA